MKLKVADLSRWRGTGWRVGARDFLTAQRDSIKTCQVYIIYGVAAGNEAAPEPIPVADRTDGGLRMKAPRSST